MIRVAGNAIVRVLESRVGEVPPDRFVASARIQKRGEDCWVVGRGLRSGGREFPHGEGDRAKDISYVEMFLRTERLCQLEFVSLS